MAQLSELSKTLYVPLVGRIHASTRYPAMIADSKVLSLEDSLPSEAVEMRRGQSEYAMLASAARSVNMDLRIRAFLADNPRGAVVNIGCGLETTFWRCDNGQALWFELDLPEVVELRDRLLPPSERHISIAGEHLPARRAPPPVLRSRLLIPVSAVRSRDGSA